MAQIQTLIRLMQSLKEPLQTCIRCGTCQTLCPLFAVTGREQDVARGKLALLTGLSQEMFQNPTGVFERLNRCLLCGACASGCPRGVDTLEIFLKARAIIAGYMGLPFIQKALFRLLLARPDNLDKALKWVSFLQNRMRFGNRTLPERPNSDFLPPLQSALRISLAAPPFHDRVSAYSNASETSPLRVAFFVGCLIDKIFPEIAEDTLNVLDYHGISVHLPNHQGCCGMPALAAGDLVAFDRLMRHHLKQFDPSDWDYLVTSCATCTSAIKKFWPRMTKDPGMKEQVLMIADKTMDISRFIVNMLGVCPSEQTTDRPLRRITYHDPCHLKKSLGISVEPRSLIRANPAYELVEMSQADACCGFGGAFHFKHHSLSSGIGDEKIVHILETGASAAATGCPACMIQIAERSAAAGRSIRVCHPVQIYAETLITSKHR
ncbi:MAG: (Fe-S)-binding protein [Desulfobacterales bacterium]|jgi:glycolate oxidase iron-sulfur subunit|nr:(Fe-S)-binding protein [Desulfobacterales bacterium]